MRERSQEPMSERATLTVAIVATVALALWMANREPFWLGPLWGASIAVAASAAWVAWFLPRPEPPGKAWSADVRGIVRGPGFATFAVLGLIHLPLLGATGLWDPWETHYGEVAREILSRDDWISLWWAQDKWFWSKPALLFWMEALSMGMLGIDFLPDAHPAHVEWAIRLPAIAAVFVALGAVYFAVRRVFGARAAALATIVTATMPQLAFISHQAITDVPLVAAITVAMCCLLHAIVENPEREATVVAVGRFKLSMQHVVGFLVVLLVLPQVAYLVSRNFSFIEGYGLVAHADRFLYGSAGNLDVPGNPAPRDQLPSVSGFLGQPFLQGLLWLSALASLMGLLRKERRAQSLWMVGFYVACALAFMAKGLVGIAIPGAAALFYLIATRRWSLLGEGRLRISLGILVVVVVSLPWYLAMYVRHGQAFLNRLLIHDHINRLATGVHGDTGTVEYFVAQLGFATFPWIAILPLAAWGCARLARRRADPRTDAVWLFAMWFLSSFVLFSVMVTKFHHYLLPAIVPIGILIGVALAALWGPRRPSTTFIAVGASAALVLGLGWLVGDPRGVVPADSMGIDDWVLQHPEPWLGAGLVAIGVALALVARAKLGPQETSLRSSPTETAIGVSLLVGACILAFVGRDLSWTTSARPDGDERLIHLFVYNYGRAWPEHLDYRVILTAFAVAATLTVVLSSLRTWRTTGVRMMVSVSLLFCAWSLNVYMTDLAPHWSARELTDRYYASRAGPEEPLLAWQMNWKGENFYTGNRVHVFAETDNERMEKWLDENQGRRVFVLLEHKRKKRFEKLVGDRPIEALSTERDNNKFLLVRLEI